jgi:ketosteroid isomerase-like protein
VSENLELVRRLQPAPDADLVALFADETDTGPLAALFASCFHADCEVAAHMFGSEPSLYTGLSGLRDGWRDWLAPWASYRAEIEELIEVGDDVVVLVRDYGRRTPGSPEIDTITAAVYTVRDGKVARAAFYSHRADALKAVGLQA